MGARMSELQVLALKSVDALPGMQASQKNVAPLPWRHTLEQRNAQNTEVPFAMLSPVL